MTPTHSIAERVAEDLLQIGGVIASTVRAVPVAPKMPELGADEAPARRQLAKNPAPFPHVTRGTAAEDVTHYLTGLTDLLGPGYDERVDTKIGALRFVGESWDKAGLIVAVAITARDPGVKSLIRGLRRARTKVER